MSEYPISLKWEISEDRLKALGNSTKNEGLKSDKFNVFDNSGVKYYLDIYPNGNDNKRRGETWIFINLELEDKKKIEAEYTLLIKSANWSYKKNRNFNKSEGYGTFCCTINKLFDSNKKFIVDGKLIVKVEGILKFENVVTKKLLESKWKTTMNFRDLWNTGFEDLTVVVDEIKPKMIEYPFALEWEISEDSLKPLKYATKNNCLKSNKMPTLDDSGVKCYLSIYPNGNNDNRRGETWIFFNLELGSKKKIEAEFTLSIKSANWEYKKNKIFTQSDGYGTYCCTVAELFESNKKFIVNGNLTVEVEGILKFQSDKLVTLREKELKIHKCILQIHSPVFATMLKDYFEKRINIFNFPGEIVEMALKLCHHPSLVTNPISVDDAILLLKFAQKYSIKMLKDNLEVFLGEMLAVSNVCKIRQFAVDGNYQKLEQKCLEFFTDCLSKKEVVPNMELLDKNFLISAYSNLTCRKFKTV